MFNLGNRQTRQNGDAGGYEPLLGDPNGHVAEDSVVFSVEDDEDDDESEHGRYDEDSGEAPDPLKRKRSVRFEDDVQVLGPPLRSTIQSREAGERLVSNKFTGN